MNWRTLIILVLLPWAVIGMLSFRKTEEVKPYQDDNSHTDNGTRPVVHAPRFAQ